MKKSRMTGMGVVLMAAFVYLPAPASFAAEEANENLDELSRWSQGRWRLELTGWGAHRSGRRSRSGDFGVSGSAEYEVPVHKRLTVGIKTIPFFYWDEDDDENGEEFFGFGFGPQFRVYQKEDVYRGWFAEIGVGIIVTTGKFDGNSGTTNFITQLGGGYQFENDWHVSLHWRHISNAGFGDKNAGINAIGLGFGYTF